MRINKINNFTRRSVFFLISLFLLPLGMPASALLYQAGGSIYCMEEKDSTWKNIGKGFEIQTNTKIKTDDKSIAVIQINKNVNLYMRSGSILQITAAGQKTAVTLIQGSLHVTSLAYVEDFIVSGAMRDLKIDSKNCLIKNMNNILLVSVFDGRVTIKDREKGYVISQGNGSSIAPGQSDLQMFSLPYPPVVEYPENKSVITSGIDLKWTGMNEAILYRLEISRDKDFINMAKAEEVNGTSCGLDNVPEGEYFWRVSSISRKNLEGIFLDSNTFVLQKGSASLTITKKEEVKNMTVSSDEDLTREPIPGENTKNSIIFGTMILLSIIILIVL
ncbi:MAG: hypothetical protein PHF84_02315 [bacterium]|nr:hypothetical protein [bacterium]